MRKKKEKKEHLSQAEATLYIIYSPPTPGLATSTVKKFLPAVIEETGKM